MKYRKKPIVIEAIQWNGTYSQAIFIQEKLGVETSAMDWKDEDVSSWTMHTLEGIINASKRDFIIKGIKNEIYPCKPSVFAKTYEKVDDQ